MKGKRQNKYKLKESLDLRIGIWKRDSLKKNKEIGKHIVTKFREK